jgi:hypothetical protein
MLTICCATQNKMARYCNFVDVIYAVSKIIGDIIDTDSYFLLIRGASVPAALFVQMLCIHPEIRFLMTVREGHGEHGNAGIIVQRMIIWFPDNPSAGMRMVLSIKVLFY